MTLDQFGALNVWRVEELTTQGWEVQDDKRDKGLSQENAKVRLEFYLGEGVSKDRLRAVLDK
jgi:hypothetical protein|tara:strand:+ start:255 stop:440 length:186 start_codon:yes stop_codon:yes gene_type:complete